jgi:hypothetical protein
VTDERHPLSWRQKKTPMRKQRRARNWVKLYPGYHFLGSTWTLKEGPWRRLKKAGSVSWVRVLCDPDHGGCGIEYDWNLNTIIRGDSRRCRQCYLEAARGLAKGTSK